MLSYLSNYSTKLSQPHVFFLACVMILLFGLLDYLTGYEVSFAGFYLVPVASVAWLSTARAGAGAAVISSLTWMLTNYLAGERYSNVGIYLWNVGTHFSFFYSVAWLIMRIKLSMEKERALARTDSLTKVLNNRAFYEVAQAEMLRAERYNHPFTLACIDVDNFKHFNNELGHAAGDSLLKTVGHTIRTTIRSTDIVARLGGDKFAVLLPEGDTEAAWVAVSNLQVRLLKEMQERQWLVTFRIGLLTCKVPPPTIDEMVGMATDLMNAVKNKPINSIKHDVFRG